MPLEFGRIVLAHVRDGHGNIKPHPAVIITSTAKLSAGAPIRVVCISTQVPSPLPSYHVPIPWQRPWHPRTGLNKPNVAKCDWIETIAPDNILRELGIVPAAQMARLQSELQKLDPEQP